MLLLKRKAYIYHILFWAGVYGLWVLLFRTYSVPLTKTVTVEFCYLLFVTADYYIINLVIIPRLLYKAKHLLFVLATVLTIALSSWLRALLAVQMNLHFFHSTTAPDFTTLYIYSFVNIALWVLIVTTSAMLADRRQTRHRLELLEKEKVRNELDYLKAQINPHALFNSLNTIYGHIDKTNTTARNILLHFSELLRYQLYDCSAEKVSLGNEMTYIANYVGFQRLRKSERLVVTLDTEEVDTSQVIAPLLLIVLIENAFKFVTDHTEAENRIDIKISTLGSNLHVSVANTAELLPAPDPGTTGGIGLVNLQRRLELLYAGKYKMTTDRQQYLYQTHLTIDLA